MAAPAGASLHIVMFTTAGKGHLFPFVELARKLLTFHNFSITIIIPDDGSPTQPQKNLLETIPTINPIFLPPISLNDVAADSPVEIPIILSVTRSIPALCDTLTGLNRTARISAFIIDLFGSFVVESVKKLGIPSYIFYAGSAMVLSFILCFPELDRPDRERPEPLRLPGCVPVRSSDFVSPVRDRNGPAYDLCMEMYRKFCLVDGILSDSFLDLEPDTFKALEETGRSGDKPPVYPVGPFVRSGLEMDVKEDCLKWLDGQPDQSVFYVAFGSGGTLSSGQLEELALGLEMSGQRFLMVVRRPNDKIRTAAYFTDGDEMNPNEYLPVGFVERTNGKGFVMVNWAPQIEVLRHAAVGGFLTHCGWNSTLESIVHGGVPLIAWPLFAEQTMNAVLLSEGLKVAMRVTEDKNRVVGRMQISGMERSLIEGEEGVQLRENMRKLKKAASVAMGDDGSSTKTLGWLVEKWK